MWYLILLLPYSEKSYNDKFKRHSKILMGRRKFGGLDLTLTSKLPDTLHTLIFTLQIKADIQSVFLLIIAELLRCFVSSRSGKNGINAYKLKRDESISANFPKMIGARTY